MPVLAHPRACAHATFAAGVDAMLRLARAPVGPDEYARLPRAGALQCSRSRRQAGDA